MRIPTLGIVLAALFSTTPLHAQQPVSLERTLVRAAPAVMKYCQEHDYKNIGVLKFLVVKAGQDKITDNVGTLNRTVARQLEMGLILSNDRKTPIGIIDNASDIAAGIPGANHLTKEGSLKLFDAKYPLAWGQDKVAADAFITGVVNVSADLKTLKIKLIALDKKTNKLDPIGADLVAANDPRKLSEMGESFSRGAFDDGNLDPKDDKDRAKQEQTVIEKAAQVKTETAKNPAEDTAAPIKLDVQYDGKPVAVEVKDGKAFLPEANDGQKVTLILKRNTPTGNFACVLKVNGENTLFRQKLPDLQCRKWLLFAEDKAPLAITGFQKDNNVTEVFRVLSRAESKSREIDYGTDVGTITLTVFPELKGKPVRADLTVPENQNTKVLEQAKLPDTKPDNFDALTAQLLNDANSDRGSGGLIVQGEKAASKIQVVKFVSDPTPVMSLTITYYKK